MTVPRGTVEGRNCGRGRVLGSCGVRCWLVYLANVSLFHERGGSARPFRRVAVEVVIQLRGIYFLDGLYSFPSPLFPLSPWGVCITRSESTRRENHGRDAIDLLWAQVRLRTGIIRKLFLEIGFLFHFGSQLERDKHLSPVRPFLNRGNNDNDNEQERFATVLVYTFRFGSSVSARKSRGYEVRREASN